MITDNPYVNRFQLKNMTFSHRQQYHLVNQLKVTDNNNT